MNKKEKKKTFEEGFLGLSPITDQDFEKLYEEEQMAKSLDTQTIPEMLARMTQQMGTEYIKVSIVVTPRIDGGEGTNFRIFSVEDITHQLEELGFNTPTDPSKGYNMVG